MKDDFDSFLDVYLQAVLGRKATGIVVLDVRKITSVADAFIICSGRSNRQVSAIADFIVLDLKKKGKPPLNVEGKKEGHWVLIDYGDVVIHIFYEPLRSFYDLEGLWSDAHRIQPKDIERESSDSDPIQPGDGIIEEFID